MHITDVSALLSDVLTFAKRHKIDAEQLFDFIYPTEPEKPATGVDNVNTGEEQAPPSVSIAFTPAKSQPRLFAHEQIVPLKVDGRGSSQPVKTEARNISTDEDLIRAKKFWLARPEHYKGTSRETYGDAGLHWVYSSKAFSYWLRRHPSARLVGLRSGEGAYVFERTAYPAKF